MHPDHIHTPYDGRAPRRVYVDGKEVHSAVYADTEHGFVEYCPGMMLDRQGEIIRCSLRGRVTVEEVEADGMERH